MRREDAAWLGGLIEGEGSFDSPVSRGAYLRVRISMTDEDTIRRAGDLVPGSRVGPESRPNRAAHHKPSWMFSVTGRNAYALMVAIFPWLGARRQARVRSLVLDWRAA